MVKLRVEYGCESCGAVFPRWQGQCLACNSWNTLVVKEEIRSRGGGLDKESLVKPIAINEIVISENETVCSNISELDTLLGSGFVRGSVNLLGGEPGIGKSTLSLQIAQKMAEKGELVLYVSAEESHVQIKLRHNRLKQQCESLWVYAEQNMGSILHTMSTLKPTVVILDSIQVICDPGFSGAAGSVGQVKHCAAQFIESVRKDNIVGLILGHITKDGAMAGPKALEHLVDTILYFEGERSEKLRILRSFKNRFWSCLDIGVFMMEDKGLMPVDGASSLFIDQESLDSPGSIVSAVTEGNRILLLEVQALVVLSGYGNARRTFLGVDPNRASVMVAAIEKFCEIPLYKYDIFITIIGGMRAKTPALDLAIVAAILSSYYGKSLGSKGGVFGELGLTGEIRAVSEADKRVNELLKCGYSCAYVPHKNKKNIKSSQAESVTFLKKIMCLHGVFYSK